MARPQAQGVYTLWIYCPEEHPHLPLQLPNVKHETSGGLWEGNISCIIHIISMTPNPRRGRAHYQHFHQSNFPLLCQMECKKINKRWFMILHINRALKAIWGSEDPWLPQIRECTFLCLNTVSRGGTKSHRVLHLFSSCWITQLGEWSQWRQLKAIVETKHDWPFTVVWATVRKRHLSSLIS